MPAGFGAVASSPVPTGSSPAPRTWPATSGVRCELRSRSAELPNAYAGSVSERASILYDADCGFCRWSLAKLLRLDRGHRLRPVSLGDPEAKLLLPGMSDEERMASWHLVGEDGRVDSGGDAFAPLLRLIPGGAPFARLAAASPSGARAAYRAVAGRRHWFGRLIPAASAARARRRIESRA